MATHFPLLSYHFDTSNRIFQEAQMSAFQKCMVEIATSNGNGNQIFRVWSWIIMAGPHDPSLSSFSFQYIPSRDVRLMLHYAHAVCCAVRQWDGLLSPKLKYFSAGPVPLGEHLNVEENFLVLTVSAGSCSLSRKTKTSASTVMWRMQTIM